ncbi:unnamed protein product [Dibothriocephalus latus]|uniref:Uncharacterized protein n=1 Tax=Dibothriocephalus latus TaxID=60516 RepID=A0A3P7LL05_DIBLA|nr:unnamed protein product [Dibothriocephalus latus]
MDQSLKRTRDETTDIYLGESQPKFARRVIGTHNAVFHCDEVLAIAMLKQLPEYKSADIIRTRDDR